MKEPFLDEREKDRLKMCVANIKDKLNSIEVESENDRPYRYYLAEKIDSILWDANCIKSLTKQTEEDE